MKNVWHKASRSLYFMVLAMVSYCIIYGIPVEAVTEWTMPPWGTETNRAKGFSAFKQASSSLWEKGRAVLNTNDPSSIVTDPADYDNPAALHSYVTNLKAEARYVLTNWFWCNTNEANADGQFDDFWSNNCTILAPPRVYDATNGPGTANVAVVSGGKSDFFADTPRAGMTSATNGLRYVRAVLDNMVWQYVSAGEGTGVFVQTTTIMSNIVVYDYPGPGEDIDFGSDNTSTTYQIESSVGASTYDDIAPGTCDTNMVDCDKTCSTNSTASSGNGDPGPWCDWDTTNKQYVFVGVYGVTQERWVVSTETTDVFRLRIRMGCWQEDQETSKDLSATYDSDTYQFFVDCDTVSSFGGDRNNTNTYSAYGLMSYGISGHREHITSYGTQVWYDLTDKFAADVDYVVARDGEVGVLTATNNAVGAAVINDTACGGPSAAGGAWVSCCGAPVHTNASYTAWTPLILTAGTTSHVLTVTNKYDTTCARTESSTNKPKLTTSLSYSMNADNFHTNTATGGDVDNGKGSNWTTSVSDSCSLTYYQGHVDTYDAGPPISGYIVNEVTWGSHSITYSATHQDRLENYSYKADPLGVILKFDVADGFDYTIASGWVEPWDEWYVTPPYLNKVLRREHELIGL